MFSFVPICPQEGYPCAHTRTILKLVHFGHPSSLTTQTTLDPPPDLFKLVLMRCPPCLLLVPVSGPPPSLGPVPTYIGKRAVGLRLKDLASYGNAIFLPPANEVCEGYVITPVCQSFCSQEGCLPQCMLGYTHPPEQTPPGAEPPMGSDTPRSRYSPQEQTPPRSRHPAGSRHPLGADTHQEQCMLGDMGNKQAVWILLECILVFTMSGIRSLTVHRFKFTERLWKV